MPESKQWGEDEMNYGTIKECDIANGEGVRTTLFVSGCTNHCKDCFQPETWDFHYGQLFTEDVEQHILKTLKPPYIDGLTLLGGEPMEPDNQRVLVDLVKKVKDTYPDKTIWCYTGFVLDQDLLEGQRRHTEVTDTLLSYIDVLVDGPFMTELKNISLAFRGSENQRIIDMKKTREAGEIVLYMR